MKFFKSKTIVSKLRGTNLQSKENTANNSFLGKPKVNKEDTNDVISYALKQLSNSEKLI